MNTYESHTGISIVNVTHNATTNSTTMHYGQPKCPVKEIVCTFTDYLKIVHCDTGFQVIDGEYEELPVGSFAEARRLAATRLPGWNVKLRDIPSQ
jgi:hypothetical protein